MDFNHWRTAHGETIEAWLSHQLPIAPTVSTQTDVYSAMRYALLGGGKRFRALLVYAGGELTQAPPQSLHYLAGAVEALHAYSLVHDDLPCMDDDDLRRGKPTCHKIYGEAMALLAGDALHALAFDWVINANNGLNASVAINIARRFSQAIGFEGMVGGQAMDIASSLSSPTDPEAGLIHLQTMHRKKTGALIAVSLAMGYLAGTDGNTHFASTPSAPLLIPTWLNHYADVLGLLFQVVDDYLDATAQSEQLGKTSGKDARDGKLTYVSLLGLPETRQKIDGLIADIRATITAAPLSPAHQQRLLDMAGWVAKRDY